MKDLVWYSSSLLQRVERFSDFKDVALLHLKVCGSVPSTET